MPGVAFDKRNRREPVTDGGFYDRYLEEPSDTDTAVAVAVELQMMHWRFLQNRTDICPHIAVTEESVYRLDTDRESLREMRCMHTHTVVSRHENTDCKKGGSEKSGRRANTGRDARKTWNAMHKKPHTAGQKPWDKQKRMRHWLLSQRCTDMRTQII